MNHKMLAYKLTFLLVFISFISCSVNKTAVKDLNTTQISFDLEVDKLGDYYIIENSFSINKYNYLNNKLYTFSDANNGELTMIDVSNPHKILVFYLEHQIILILDNTLSEIGKIELDNNSFYTAAGRSNDGYIWLYDSFLLRLIKIDNVGNKIEESFPVSTNAPKDIVKGKIYDRDNYVMIVDKEKGLLLYNNLGSFNKMILLKNVSKPNIISNNLFYYDKGESKFYNFDLRLSEKSLAKDFSDNNIKPSIVIYENNQFYVLNDNKVRIVKK